MLKTYYNLFSWNMNSAKKELFEKAVLDGDLETVRSFLSSGGKANMKCDGCGTSLLHLVRSPEIAKELIKFGANIEVRDSFGRTPLCRAVAYSQRLEVVSILLSSGAKVNVRMGMGVTPLHMAPNVELTNLLISHGAEVNTLDKLGRAPIHSALIDDKGFDVFKALLKAGANVNIPMGRFGNTLLHYADSLDFTKELLSRGAHVDAEKIDGQTPLHCALRHMKEAAVVRELLKWGACVNIQDHEGETPLGLALRCHVKNYDAIKVLMKYGADINFPMFDCSLFRYCTVIESALFNDLPCAKLLVKMYILKKLHEGSTLHIEFESEIHPNNAQELLKYKEDCIIEINQMKSDRMFLKYTLYELLFKNEDCVHPIYGSYIAIEQSLESMYPIYHDVIMEKVKNGLERGRLLIRLEQFYMSLKLYKNLEQKIKLNLDCLLLIARYLGDSDILNIILTFEDYLYNS